MTEKELNEFQDKLLLLLQAKRKKLEDVLHNDAIDKSSSLYQDAKEKWNFSVKLSRLFF